MTATAATTLADSTIDWSDGRLLTLVQGQTARCSGGLNPGQLYALFFYNIAPGDADTLVTVTGTNSQSPVKVNVPGTTGNLGLAALCFVSGDDTTSVSAAVSQAQPGAQLQAFIGSVKMPTNTSGITNSPLPFDGQLHPFSAFTRFSAVPESHWYSGQIQSNVNQFISVQFTSNRAQVNVVNALQDPSPVIYYYGTAKSSVTIKTDPSQTLAWSFQGNGGQLVWINADSIQNSQSATISAQSLTST